MSLGDYRGASNTPDVFPHLVGERIVGAFRDYIDGSHQIVLILESGCGFVIAANGSYWRISREQAERCAVRRRQELEARIGELRLLNAGVPVV